MDAVGVDLAEAVRELPEEHPQPDVEPRLLGDRHRDHEPQRAPSARPASSAPSCGQAAARAVQRGSSTASARGATTRHVHSTSSVDIAALVLPRPQQVARAEQLGRVAALDPGAPEQQPVQHEQAVAAAGAIGVDRRLPAARREAHRRRAGGLARLRALIAPAPTPPARIHVENADQIAHLPGSSRGTRHNAPVPNPRLGYILVALSAACSALNGSLARYLLDDGMSAVRLSQLRSAVAFVLLLGGLAAVLAATRLRIARADVAKLAWLGDRGHRARARELLRGDRADRHRGRARDPVPRARRCC